MLNTVHRLEEEQCLFIPGWNKRRKSFVAVVFIFGNPIAPLAGGPKIGLRPRRAAIPFSFPFSPFLADMFVGLSKMGKESKRKKERRKDKESWRRDANLFRF